MATRSPFPFVDGLLDAVGQRLAPPPWAIQEAQRRLVLLLNHVLMQEPQAMERLRRQAGRIVEGRWRIFHVRLVATPAGLLDLAGPAGAPDLTLTVTEDSPWALGQAALRGAKPPVRIEGDVQFAAEVNWLVDHVRWDVEEDLARVLGDAPAHAIGQAARGMAEALRRFIPQGAAPAPGGPAPATPAATAGGTGPGPA
jgi:ubiquinone biosynthesis accessory factor UbiJ